MRGGVPLPAVVLNRAGERLYPRDRYHRLVAFTYLPATCAVLQ